MLDFILRREIGHYVLEYYIPSLLLVAMSWVGFWLDCERFEIGLSDHRCQWLVRWMESALEQGAVLVPRLHECLGRMAFGISAQGELRRDADGPWYTGSQYIDFHGSEEAGEAACAAEDRSDNTDTHSLSPITAGQCTMGNKAD